MSDANQLKIQARREEAAGDYAQASRLYRRALSEMETRDDLPDPSLLVRVADLEYRQEDSETALEYYRRAVEEYAEQGLITNAIAVCNKILRVFPDSVDCYRRLADLHLDVGLTAEARQNLMKYADRAWDPGSPAPVLDAMRDFLDRTPDQDVALRLADQMEELDRADEGLDALREVWEMRTQADADVESLEHKARELDPGLDLAAWATGDELDDASGEDGLEPPGADAAGSDAAGAADGEPPARPDGRTPVEDEDEGGAAPEADEAPAADEVGGVEEDADARDPGRGPLVEGLDARTGAFTGRGEPARDDEPAADERPAARDDEPSPGEAPEDEDEPAEPAWWSAGARFGGAPGDEDPFADADADDEAPAAETNGREGPAAAAPGSTDEVDESADAPEAAPRWAAAEASVGDPLDAAVDADAGVEAEDPVPTGGLRIRETGAPVGAPDENDVELVASYRERFTQVAALGPSNGEGPSTDPEPRAHREEHVMDELERGSDAATGTSWWEEEDLGTRGEGTAGEAPSRDAPEAPAREGAGGGPAGEPADPVDPAGPAAGGLDGRTPPPVGEGDDELGEEAELRRGLELVDEMLEVQPDSLKLRERKVRYARRLGDRDTLVDAYLDLADRLAQEDSRRSARAIYREVLELAPDNEAAEAGLARLDVGELEDKRQSGKRAGAGSGTPEASSPQEQEARRELGMRLWTEFENSIREMPWLHAATQAYQATGPESLPPLETFEMLAHYLMARGRHRDAAEILSRALQLGDREDEAMADVLYHLGVAHEKLGEEGRAEEYFRRLEAVDPEFSRVRSTLSEAEQGS